MQIVMIIPTHNRSILWKRQLLFEWVLKQTDLDFSLMVCDDASTDDTIDVITPLMQAAPMPCKLFRVIEPRPQAWQASPVSDNVMFKEAIKLDYDESLGRCEGQRTVLVHLDDDGKINPGLIKKVRSTYETLEQFDERVMYGKIFYTDFDKQEVIEWDGRSGEYPQSDITEIPKSRREAWGALWTAPVSLIRRLGGHHMPLAQYRGADARLGWQMHQAAKVYFASVEELCFWHDGLSHYQKAVKTGNDWEYLQNTRAPWNRDHDQPPLISNNGPHFWKDEFFPIKYECVYSNI